MVNPSRLWKWIPVNLVYVKWWIVNRSIVWKMTWKWGLWHLPTQKGIQSLNSVDVGFWSKLGEKMWVFESHLVFSFPSKLRTSSRIPANFHDRNSTCFSCLTSRSIISAGSSMKLSLSSIWISSKGMTDDSSERHFLRFETWNVLCTLLSSAGSSSLYATGQILSKGMKSDRVGSVNYVIYSWILIKIRVYTLLDRLYPES